MGNSFTSATKGRAGEVWNIIKEDTREILDKLKPPKQVPKKRLNIWVWLFAVVSLLAGFMLMLPLLGGMISMVFPEVTKTETLVPSEQAITTFILIAAALGTLILWFAERGGRSQSEKERMRLIRILGKEFLLSAMALTVFLMTSPLLPDIRNKTGFSWDVIRWVSLGSFLGGGVIFIAVVIESFFEIPRM